MKKDILLFTLCFLLGISCYAETQKAKITAYKQVAPVLIGETDNPVLTIKVNNPTTGEIVVDAITLSAQGSDLQKDLENLRIYFTGNSGQFNSQALFGKSKSNGANLTFKGHQVLKPGDNYFWTAISVSPKTDLRHKINIEFRNIKMTGATPEIAATAPVQPSAMGIAVRRRHDDKCDTYRIPGLVKTPKGTLLAVYDIRWNNAKDLQEDIDVGVSRSLDNGQTWLPMQKAIDMGKWGGKSEKENGIGDPAILVDNQTGRIWVSALWLHGKAGKMAWWESQPGITPEQTGQFVLAYSDDEGATWSEPVSITPQIKLPEWHLCFNGPGMGITQKDGTLVFAAQFKDKDQIPHSTIVYSKDRGQTWHIGTGAKSKTTEAQVVELADGSLMLNMRDDRGGSRSIATTTDLGKTWTEHPTSRKALREPVC